MDHNLKVLLDAYCLEYGKWLHFTTIGITPSYTQLSHGSMIGLGMSILLLSGKHVDSILEVEEEYQSYLHNMAKQHVSSGFRTDYVHIDKLLHCEFIVEDWSNLLEELKV